MTDYRQISAALDFLSLEGDRLVAQVVEAQYAADPQSFWRTNTNARARCTEDNRFHLHYLTASLRAGNPKVFSDYCGWVKIVLQKRGIPVSHFVKNLELWKSTLLSSAPEAMSDVIAGYFDVALERLPAYPDEPVQVAVSERNRPLVAEYIARILAMDSEGATELIESRASDAASILDLFTNVLQPAQREIGRLWQVNSISVAVEHYATATAQQILHRLSYRVPPRHRRNARIIGICGEGEYHCVGLEMICSLCRLDGWDTYFVGANTPLASAVGLSRELQSEIVAVSMTTLISLQNTRTLIAKLKEALPEAGVVVGGYAASLGPDLWKIFGADAYAADAVSAMTTMQRVLNDSKNKQRR
jgi:methanogenic corrinoid protein MtbC1